MERAWMLGLIGNLLNCTMDLQLQQLQSESNNGVPPLTEVIQVLGSPQMTSLEMLECLLSKEELWFEENDSSCQRTLKNHKHEREREREGESKELSCFCVSNTEECTCSYRQMNAEQLDIVSLLSEVNLVP